MLFYAILVLCGVCQVEAAEAAEAAAEADTISKDPKVETNEGWVVGYNTVAQGKPLDLFLGIPYAKPPIGDLRFKRTQPAEKRTEIWDATSFGKGCLQRFNPLALVPTDETSEDCLYLNIYSPSMTPGRPLVPVMFWIHGGAYVLGSSNIYNGTNLATKDVIVVTFNYRLDVLGFLSTENSTMPGNYGLMDQLQALQWVNDNIEKFGGDKKRITILGESVGSVSVSLFLLSPLTEKLFSGAIMASGNSLALWAAIHPAQSTAPKVVANIVIEKVNCHKADDLLKCLQNVDAKDLLAASVTVLETTGADVFVAPRVEKDFGFLPDLPIRLLARGEFNHVPTMRGFNRHEEANLRVYPESPNYSSFDKVVHDVTNDVTFVDKDIFVSDNKKIYLRQDNTSSPTTIKQDMERFCTDINFIYPIVHELEYLSKHSHHKNHYIYEFSHRPAYSFLPPWVSAAHGDDCAFVFGIDYLMITEKDKEIRDIMMQLYTNFAKTRNPTDPPVPGIRKPENSDQVPEPIQWEPYTPNKRIKLTITDASTEEIIIPDYYAEKYKKVIHAVETRFYKHHL